MGKSSHDKLSVFISLVLRHQPDAAGIELDEHGWADVSELIQGINTSGRRIDMDLLEEIVRTDGKGRYRFNDTKTKIRANQGHSVKVDVELEERKPPKVLYHGTTDRFLENIMRQGLQPMNRLYVHLSKDYETAVKVGRRHGTPVVLTVNAGIMSDKGIKFYLSENGVWLTKEVEAGFLEVI